MAVRKLFTECSFTLSDKVPGQDKSLMKKIMGLDFSVQKVDPLIIKKSSLSSCDIKDLLSVINQAFEPQFAECSFTLSDKVPGQDKQLMKKITDLDFSVNKVVPLVIKKSFSSSCDIENLLGVINQAFEPQVEANSKIIECSPSLGDVDQNVASSFAEASEGRATHKSETSSSSSMDFDLEDKKAKSPVMGEVNEQKMCSSVGMLNEFITEKRRTTVKVIKGDITTLKVDAVVSAANSRLRHGGGVARAIADKAGPTLQKECSDYTRGEARFPVTGFFVSTGGKLPAKHVFHAVGPKWERYGEIRRWECARDLRLTVFRCLLEANLHGVKSIAIPSISAVPKDICTRAYLEAIKTYDLYSNKMKRNSLEKIIFVDIVQEMVTSIEGRFSLDWTKEVSLLQATEDFNFAANYMTRNHEPKETTQNRGTGHSSFQGLQTKKPNEESQRSHQSRPRSPQKRPTISEEQMYTFKQCRLRTSTEAALKLDADLIVVVGDLFRKLHDSPAFDVTSILHLKSDYPMRKSAFAFYEGLKHYQVILKLDLENQSYCQDSIDKAFRTLKLLTDCLENLLQAQSVLFTSSLLFSGDNAAGAYPRIDHKLVGAFTRNVHEFLESFRPSKGLLSATIATGAEALTTITKVLDSRQKGQEPKGGSRKATDLQEEDCGVCLNDKFERHPLTCCKGVLCTTCAKKVQRCPFCQKPFRRMRGNQPDGRMTVRFSHYTKLKGNETHGTYTITYDFPGGIQGPEHPDPGKKYDPVTRIAFIPASAEGNRVLQLLRLAFLRRLTFTIGDSITTTKKGVITWNDIHHKTSLKEGSPFGYPDQKYLSKVMQELADRGVTMESMSEEEKRDLAKIERDLRSKQIFFD